MHIDTYDGKVKAVDGVNLNIFPGEIVGIVGESGSGKSLTSRTILKLLPEGGKIVSGKILMKKETLDTALEGNLKKGDLFSVAKTSGINAAKWTHLLIPMCHPIPVSNVVIDIVPNHNMPGLEITSTVKANWNTGVEMEAFTAVSIT